MRVSATQIYKFNVKFEHKMIRRRIFAFRRGGFKFYDGSYLVGSD
ncbi:hypothetical protein [Campylobacter showae]|nr:hypothetical protein [Campylobacter showae]